MNRRQPLSRALDEDGYSSGAGRVRRTGADARMTWRRTAIRSNSTAGQNGPPRYFQRRHATYDLLGSRFSQQHGGDTENEDSEVDGTKLTSPFLESIMFNRVAALKVVRIGTAN